jgi:hypothetical protein
MSGDDYQVYVFRCRDLDDLIRWGAHNHLANDLDPGSVSRWRYFCEITMALAFQVLQEHGGSSWRDKAYVGRQLFDDMQEHKLRTEYLCQLVGIGDSLFGVRREISGC